jgi:transposase, IS30 family
MRKPYKQLSIEDREKIAFLKARGRSLRSISKVLSRSHTSISRELRRNPCSPLGFRYAPHKAQMNADITRKQAARRKRLKCETIIQYVTEKLQKHWSPEQISVRLSMEYPHLKISHEAIYQYVYTDAPKLIALLPRRHKKRHPKRPWSNHQNLKIHNRRSIKERPEIVNLRLQFGHWESDSMMSKTGYPTTAHVLVERESRLTKISKIKKNGPEDVKEAILRRLGQQPRQSRRSITYDNGPENRRHDAINKVLRLDSYFCHPYRSWEKGTVENTIGLVRRFIPKGSDLQTVPTTEFRRIENLLNNRPRKCLNYRTPKEVYETLSGALRG